MTSLFVLAGGHVWWICRRVVPDVLKDHPDAAEWRISLVAAGWIMVGIVLVNAQGFVKFNLMDWEVGPEGVRGTWLKLLASHLSVLAGTHSLMWLVARAIRDPAVLREPTPQLAGYRVMVTVAERQLPRFWWAALGLGVVFGYTAGRWLVVFLAADLTLFWAVGRIGLAVQHRQLRRDQIAQEPPPMRESSK